MKSNPEARPHAPTICSLNGDIRVLTKGDNNDVHDRGLYNRGQLWLEQDDFVGRVKVYVRPMCGPGVMGV